MNFAAFASRLEVPIAADVGSHLRRRPNDLAWLTWDARPTSWRRGRTGARLSRQISSLHQGRQRSIRSAEAPRGSSRRFGG